MKVHEKKEYHVSADILRILAILAVVLIHTSTKSLDITGYHVEKTTWTLFLNQSARFAVPLFFLISGFVLELNYKESFSYIGFFKKRAVRIIAPYVFWSIFYEFIVFGQKSFGIISVPFAKTLLLGTASYQLYFIPSLIIFYLLFPLLHHKLQYIQRKSFLVPLAILEILLLSIDYHLSAIHLPTPVRIVLLNYLLFIVGMIAAHHKNYILSFAKKFNRLLIAIFIVSVIGVFYESKLLFLNTRNISYIYSQYHPLMVIYTLLLSLITFYYFDNVKRYTKEIATLSRLSFFVFFIHVAVLEFVWNAYVEKIVIQTHGKIVESIWFDPLLFAFVATISFTVALAAHKIPKFNLLVG